MQRLRKVEDIDKITFEDGMAAVEVPVELLRHITFKNDERGESPRLDAVERSIRDRGFVPTDPIIARIGQKGRWIIVDGGHRLTAARHVAEEFWTNLIQRKVSTLYFILYETERSWRKIGRPEAAGPSPFAKKNAAEKTASEHPDAEQSGSEPAPTSGAHGPEPEDRGPAREGAS